MPTELKRILIIDDEPANAEAVADFLSEHGFLVSRALTAKEGLEKVADEFPDLVLLDLYLPDMLGYDVCSILREAPATRHLPIILCTAKEINSKDRAKGFKFGVDDFLVRPFDVTELLARIQAVLRRAQAKPTSDFLEHLKSVVEKPAKRATKEAKKEFEHAEAPAHQEAESLPHVHRRKKTVAIFDRFWTLLHDPETVFRNVSEHANFVMSLTLVFLMPVVASFSQLGNPSGLDAWLSYLSLGIAKNVTVWLAIAGVLHLLFPFFDISLSTRDALVISGLSSAPHLVGGAISALYAWMFPASLKFETLSFTAGLNLIPGIPNTEWVAFISRVGLFDLWSAYLVLCAVWTIGNFSKNKWNKITIAIGVICLLFGVFTNY